MSILFSQSAGLNDAKFGKLETPLRMLMMHESDLCAKEQGPLQLLYNVERSSKIGETFQNQDEFDLFSATVEGGRGENDTFGETSRKFIEHIPFMKNFTITKQMLDDAVNDIGVSGKNRARNFVRSYYKTQHYIASKALVSATSASLLYRGAQLDLTTGDGKALFAIDHTYGKAQLHGAGSQSNLYGHNRGANTALTVAHVEEYFAAASEYMRGMRDENGLPLGYQADTVIIPSNLRSLEQIVRKVLGSEHEPSSANNAINTQYGNWNLIVLPTWEYTKGTLASQTYPIIFMSSEANRQLQGNMFFNRVPLDMKNWEDGFTRNWIWNGYCRFGIGYPSYKHILMLKSYANANADATVTAI